MAERILRENGGGTMHIKDITKAAIEKKYVLTKGKKNLKKFIKICSKEKHHMQVFHLQLQKI